jgi:hypothetical protein
MNFRAMNAAICSVHDEMVNQYGCGWFDGACYTLTASVCEILEEAVPFHISRTYKHRDHAVAYIPSSGKYFDADGLQASTELFRKMAQDEMTLCTVLEPFTDINRYPVYADVKRKLIQAYQLAEKVKYL